ncbi:hypothetical protein, partial [Thalassospira sp. MCCC 1A01428]|uniref:hypothetical protein n=1 Tax=Thalassospira sp. MCCC 1A01428 TaxID=1470575 RepID=UPI000A24C8B8
AVRGRLQNTKGEVKKKAEAQAVETILKLWMHRRALPEQVDPLGGFRDAISVMERLGSVPDRWSFQQYGIPNEQTLRDMFGCLCRIVRETIVFTQIKQAREITSDEIQALDEDELAAHQLLTTWLADVEEPERLPTINRFIVDAKSKTGDMNDGKHIPPNDKLNAEGQEKEDARRAILENLERMHLALGKIVAYWRSNTGEPPE